MTTIATRIAEARKGLNLNQSELARILSVTPQAVQSWESGKARPKGARLENLAKALKKSTNWLLTGMADGEFMRDASENITASALAHQLKERVFATSKTIEEANSKLQLAADWLIASDQVRQAEQEMRAVFTKYMEEGEWFTQIKDPRLMMHVYNITLAAAQGKLLVSEVETLEQISARIRSTLEAEGTYT